MLPMIYLDFNKGVDDDVYSLNTLGSRDDLASAGIAASPGSHAVFYDWDGFDDGTPAWLLIDGTIVAHPVHGFVARVDSASIRWVPRGPKESRPAV